jgi:ribonuclease P protein component
MRSDNNQHIKSSTFTQMVKFTFAKEERLKSKKTIDALFLNQGLTAFTYPIKAVFNTIENSEEHIACPSIAITVPKKKFKSAVARNRIKRQIKEAYRLNSTAFKGYCTEHKVYIPIVFIYIAQQAEPYGKIDTSLQKIIKSIIQQHGTSTDKKRHNSNG